MKSFYVYSTLSSDVTYENHVPAGNDIPQVVASVTIKGGAGVANDRLITPRGVVTRVTEEQVEQLRQNKVFQLHEKNGFVQVSEHSVEPDKAAADMTGRDPSAPVVPEDLPAGDQPKVGDPTSDDDAPAPQVTGGKKKR